MMDSEGHIWEDYLDFLKEKYLKSGLNDLNAQLRAESYNIWSQLGFSYNSLKKECQDYLAKKDNGGCLDGDEFPQDLWNKVDAKRQELDSPVSISESINNLLGYFKSKLSSESSDEEGEGDRNTNSQPNSEASSVEFCPSPQLIKDVKSVLYFDHHQQKTICPVKDGQADVVIANFIPKVMGHTDEGFAFHLANKYHDNERAYKVSKRFELSSPQLRQNILKSLSQAGRHWLFIQDPKSSDARASFGYLLQQLTEDYDKKPENEKVKIQTASHSGFCGGLYILDQYNQVDLKTMKWVSSEDLVMLQSKEKDEIDFTMRVDISLHDSKQQTVRLTQMLEVGWSLPQILLLRACHTYTLLAPYAKDNCVISTPVCVHYSRGPPMSLKKE